MADPQAEYALTPALRATGTQSVSRPRRRRSPRDEPAAIRWALIALAAAFLVLFLFVPLAAVFAKR